MLDIFDEKVIISGFEVERYQYPEKSIVRGYKRKKRKENNEKKEQKKQTEKTKFAVNRTRNEIRRIINSNPQLNKFLTLTSKITEIKKINPLFNLFIQRIKSRYPKFQYMAVPEFQKDTDFFGKVKPEGGAVHYHTLCNLPYVKSKEIEKIWGHGFIRINRVDRVDNLGAYVCKYLQKEMFDKRMFHKKKYFCSQDINRPEEFTGEQAKIFMDYMKDNLEFKKGSVFENEYRGIMLYKLFHNKHLKNVS
jgi:hypothetical protein